MKTSTKPIENEVKLTYLERLRLKELTSSPKLVTKSVKCNVYELHNQQIERQLHC